MKAYPTPGRWRWSVMIQMLDGTQIAGTSDADVIDRWRSLHWAAPDMTPDDFKDRIAGFARALYACELPGVGGATGDEAFLDALAAEGVLEVIRK